jgi:hypothetical protein
LFARGANIDVPQKEVDPMTTLMLAFSFAVVMAFVLEWGQRKCEVWAQLRDKDL